MAEPDVVATRQVPSRRRALAFKVLLLATTFVLILITLVAGEFAMRHRERTRTTAPDYFPNIYYPHRRVQYGLVPSLDYYGWFRINSLGFRGREVSRHKAAGTVRVVCLGGSTTFDTGVVGSALPWPEVLEKTLAGRFPGARVEVLNLGIPGAAALDSLIDLQTRALGLEPDIIVVFQGHNDLRYSTRPAAVESGLYPNEQPPRSRLGRWLQLNSILYAKAYGPLENMFQSALVRLHLAPDPQEGFTPERQRERVASGLDAFRTHVRSMLAIARANDIQVVMPELIYPREQPGGEPCAPCSAMPRDYGGLSYATIAAAFDKYNGVIRQLANTHGGHSVSTADWIPGSRKYFSDTVHFSPEGSREMGTRLGEALVPIVARAVETKTTRAE